MSTKDLSNLGRAILTSSLLRPAKTREWLKPRAHTAALKQSVGAPWEIYRVTRFTQDGRVVDLYTKVGGTGLYNSLLVLVPDYDIGLTLFSAGDETPVSGFAQQILEAFIPVIELVGKKQAAAQYNGIYDSQPSETSDSSTSSIELSVDKGPGLVVKHWTSENKDVLKAYNDYFGFQSTSTDLRLYPTGLKKQIRRQRTTSYRAVFQSVQANFTNDERTAAETDPGKIFSHCSSWGFIDAYVYGSIGVDDFVFRTDALGNLESIEPRATRTILKKRASALEST